MHAARGISSSKYAYSYEKVVSGGPNINWLNPENTYQSPWYPPTTLICFQVLAEFYG